jgi:hypothetical protein
MLPATDRLREIARGNRLDMEANLIAHLIDLEVAGIAEAEGKQKPHVPTNPERNSGSRG